MKDKSILAITRRTNSVLIQKLNIFFEILYVTFTVQFFFELKKSNLSLFCIDYDHFWWPSA